MGRKTQPTVDRRCPLLSSAWKQSFRRRLLSWYRRHARDLPWRRSRDPYRVWISEIMLQQTQVATVESYFKRFIAALPDVRSLAEADEGVVLRLWEGLGYYRRARQLHRAARQIVDEHGGRFPTDVAAVRRLPGIGRYTAGAILSIALDAREPILEANTVRLYSRLIAYDGQTTTAEGQRLLWQVAEELLPRRAPGTLNQALMELGSQVCTPREPACHACPAATLCAARAENLQDVLPQPKPKTTFTALREAAVVIHRRGKVLILKYGDGGRWAGLWDFPRFGIESCRPATIRRELVDRVEELTGTLIEPTEHLTTIKHGVTRYRITLDCHAARYISGRTNSRQCTPLRWVKLAELDAYPLSTTGRKIGQLVAGLKNGV